MICSANQWNGFYMIGTSAMKKLSQYKLAKIRGKDTLFARTNEKNRYPGKTWPSDRKKHLIPSPWYVKVI